MSIHFRSCGFVLCALLASATPIMAQSIALKNETSFLCHSASQAVEQYLHIPEGFLDAISRVETGRDNNGTLSPWPWTINVNGKGFYYKSKSEAIEAVETYQKEGIRSIDVGCMQVNIMHHPDAFSSLKDAFDPLINARYAGEFLLRMKNQTGSWPRAAAAYHSLIEDKGNNYLHNVLTQWAIPFNQTKISTENSLVGYNHSPAQLSQDIPSPTAKPQAPYRPFALFHANNDGTLTPIHSIYTTNQQNNPPTTFPTNSIPTSHGGGINHTASSNVEALKKIRERSLNMTLPSSGTGYTKHPFHPFKGFFRPSSPPPPHPRLKTTENGRSLDSYRKMPVHDVAPMPHLQTY